MLSNLVCRSPVKEVSRKGSNSPALPPAVIRSLYRGLLREVSWLDRDPVAKTLFPLTKDLQEVVPQLSTLYVPNGIKYVNVLRKAFNESVNTAQVTTAFGTLNRLRAHRENLVDKRSVIQKDSAQMLSMLKTKSDEQKKLYRAECLPQNRPITPKYVAASSTVPTKVILRHTSEPELDEGTVLVAHPLSSTHVDRRVLLITERTPLITSAVVLDLQYTYPLSRGNPMFPEVFWGHDVFDGGFSQIGFTMPPTAQIVILHTLSPLSGEEAGSPEPQYKRWLKWTESEVGQRKVTHPKEEHLTFCKPLIKGGRLEDGTVEPTLYLSKTEALPYLASLAAGQPRSSLRVFWGCMRWTTAQIETEVANGHWIPVKISPSFFKAYDFKQRSDEDRFPTEEELRQSKDMRTKRYGADISLPQSFPPDQILRRRECLWDQLLYALGGEYTTLVGCSNPFSGLSDSSPHILSPSLFLEPPSSSSSELSETSTTDQVEKREDMPADINKETKDAEKSKTSSDSNNEESKKK